MVFAFIDYLKYRLQYGRYSPARLSSDGGFLADRSTLNRLDNVRDGDIIGCHPTDFFLGWVVMYVSDYPFSHVGILTTGQTVIEATLSGTVERPAAEYFDGRHYLQIRRVDGLDDDAGKEVVASARSRIGSPYGLLAALNVGVVAVTGAHPHYCVQHSVDILLILAGVGVLLSKFPTLGCWIVGALAVTYIATLAVNRVRMRRKLSRHGWVGRY